MSADDLRTGEFGLPTGTPHLSALDGLIRRDGSVVVPASVAADMLRLLVLGLDARVRADGGQVSPRARALLLELHRAAQAYDEGASVASPELDGPPSATVEVSVAEAARVIGASREYVRRLCRREVLPARRIGREWLVTIERQHLEQDE